jgi:Fic family protein
MPSPQLGVNLNLNLQGVLNMSEEDMAEIDIKGLSAEEVELIDRQYQSVPSFNEWATGHIDNNLWSETKKLLAASRKNLTEAALAEAHEKVLRAAAVTSGAIEGLYQADRGFTITVAEQMSAWQQRLAERGPWAFDLFEAQMRAYHAALDVATGKTPISQAWVRSLHEILTEPQETYSVITAAGPQEQPLPAGQYKVYPNHVTLPGGAHHAYAPVNDTQSEMTRLIDGLNTAEFNSAHPVLQCSYAHFALTAIHPFADGNGRVARALASVWLLRELSIPLVIFTEEKADYLSSLRQADGRDYQAFVDFVSEHTTDSVMLTLEMIDRSKVPALEKSLADLRSLLTYRDDIGHDQMDRFAQFLLEAFSVEVASVSNEYALPEGVQFSAGLSQSGRPIDFHVPGFRPQGAQFAKMVQLSLSVTNLSEANSYLAVSGHISTDRDDSFPLALGVDDEIVMRFRISEVRNGITVAARLRLHSLAEQLISRLLTSVQSKTQEELKKAGYRFDE